MTMDKVSVLIGIGDNDVKIPGLIFQEPLEEAKDIVEKLLGIKGVEIKEQGHFSDILVGDYVFKLPTPPEDEIHGYVNPITKVYVDYYGGCGECHAFLLREVPFATPFVSWDLD
jgi:hypothetical protein